MKKSDIIQFLKPFDDGIEITNIKSLQYSMDEHGAGFVNADLESPSCGLNCAHYPVCKLQDCHGEHQFDPELMRR